MSDGPLSRGTRAYLELERELLAARARGDEAAEDPILDRMDEVWWSLTDDERSWIDARPVSTQGAGADWWQDKS